METVDQRSSLYYEIAGVSVGLASEAPLSERQIPSVYESFLRRRSSGVGPLDIDVNLVIDNLPDLRKMRKVFDTGRSWSMFSDGMDFFMALDSAAPDKQTSWVAHFNRNFDKATIYCGDLFLKEENGATNLLSPFSYPLDQMLLMFFLASRKGAIFHAAGIRFSLGGCIFLGRSGAGKSTISRLFCDRKSIEVLGDDRIVVRRTDGAFRAYGTPWPGEAGIAVNESYVLSAIFFISHGKENIIREISRRDAMERLLPVTSIPWFDEELLSGILIFCEDMLSHVPAYEFDFIPDSGGADVLERFLSKL